jgi:cysteinyl-tRNA synthetase
MQIYNTLTRKEVEFHPIDPGKARMYSCGPTVYDHIHIGNLSAFIAADTLRRTLAASGLDVRHVMNITDIDDKTIRRSAEKYPELEPHEALKKLTREYEEVFMRDMELIGNDIRAVEFMRATESIEAMRQLILELFEDGLAYITDDGVYFSIEKYKKSGKTYGQLLELNTENTSAARIDNDEYGKESVHDFALWKARKDTEPSWEFELDAQELTGRPGWHIECSAMSVAKLGQPFDIHTGGIDLIFPHHENEIAQSTAGAGNTKLANYFVHNEHLLVDGKKMSKSLNNFFTLRDIQDKGFDPLAFRLMILQSHYRSQSNFTWENLEAAHNRLNNLYAIADLQWNTIATDSAHGSLGSDAFKIDSVLEHMQNDLNTPLALAAMQGQLDAMNSKIEEKGGLPKSDHAAFLAMLKTLDALFGLNLADRLDVSTDQKELLAMRQDARTNKDWNKSDEIRDQLKEQGIHVRDTAHGQIWSRA